MQPVWGIPGERIENAIARLEDLRAGMSKTVWIDPVLFLCGLKYGMTRFDAGWLVGHVVDDGLGEATRLALPVLIRVAKSKEMRRDLRSLGLETGWEFAALRTAFATFERKLPPTVMKWVQRGDAEQNRRRLALSLGVRARFEPVSMEFVARVLGSRFTFVNGADRDCGDEVKAVVGDFQFDPSWALPL
jgi:hypothetical protein